MATRRERGILVGEMVIGAHIERHPFSCCLRGWRRAIERLGIGWLLLSPFFTLLPTEATLPSIHKDLSRACALRAAMSRQATSGGWALMVPSREGRDR
jgi:hypothetical protein